MTRPLEDELESESASPSRGWVARLLIIVTVNVGLVIVTVVWASSGGELPDLNVKTLAIGLLPLSAAMGLVLACRRIDLSLPAILALVFSLRASPHLLPNDPLLRLALLCGLAAGIGLLSALLTWYGRIASALWTAILAFGLWLMAGELEPVLSSRMDDWPWPAAVGASLGLLVIGATLLGATRLVNLPSLPPILRSGSQGLAGLAGAWMFAGAAVALAAQSNVSHEAMTTYPLAGYPAILAAMAMGGAFILRGRWGALTAVVLTCVGHLTWSLAWSANFGARLPDAIVPAASPLLAILLYLIADRAIRLRTGESAPTGLLA